MKLSSRSLGFLKEIVPWAAQELKNSGIDRPQQEALWILERAEGSLPAFTRLIETRKARIPLAYVLGTQEFLGRTFFVDFSVLIPRPETEVLVRKVLEILPDLPSEPRILEIGTGS